MRHKEAILRYLFSKPDEKNSKAISKALRLDNTEVCKTLYDLRENLGLIYHTHGKFNKLTDKGVLYCEQHMTTDKEDNDDSECNDDETGDRQAVDMTEDAAVYKNKADNQAGVDAALEVLAQKLNQQTVEGLKLKLDLLSRLSELMDDSISEVLDDIGRDLRGRDD